MDKPKKVFRKRKRNSDADNEKEAIPNTATSRALFVDDVVCDILSRLPVKSLMRFKCVSKHWLSLIKDPYFRDLHFRTSKAPARLLFLMPPKSRPKNKSAGISYQEVCFKTADLLSEVTGRTISTIYTTSKSFGRLDFLGPVNGLICFTKKFKVSVCIFNISTREVMTLGKLSTSRDNVIRGGKTDSLIYGFGYDPATKHYKVICNGRVSTKNGNQISVGHFWEVLTLGTNSWRRIEDVPSLPDGLTPFSIHVNGSIYWFPEKFQKGIWNHGVIVCIMAFDVGSEKFRKIQIPQFIVDQPIDFYPAFLGCVRLQEVKGCLAILRRVKDSAVKLWIHDESWNEQMITLPGCVYKSLFPTVFFFHSITGTDQLILEILQTDTSGNIKYKGGNKKFMSLFSYNWQDKTFEKMKISGIPSSATVCTCFVESLISFPEAEMKQPIQPST